MNSDQQTFSPTVELEFLDEGQVALVTLVDKARANAMSPEMGDAFRAVVEKLKSAPQLRATVICGEGKDFSIGGARQMLSGLAPLTLPSRRIRPGFRSPLPISDFIPVWRCLICCPALSIASTRTG